MRTLTVLLVALSASCALAVAISSDSPAAHLTPLSASSAVTPITSGSSSGASVTDGSPACVKGGNDANCHEDWRGVRVLSWRKPASEKEAMNVLKERVKAAVAPIDDFLKEVKKISGTENEFRAARAAVEPMVKKLKTVQLYNEEELAADNERMLKEMEEKATQTAYKILLRRRDHELGKAEADNLVAKAASAAAEHLRSMVMGNASRFDSSAVAALQQHAESLVVAASQGIKDSSHLSRSGSSSSASSGSRYASESRFAEAALGHLITAASPSSSSSSKSSSSASKLKSLISSMLSQSKAGSSSSGSASLSASKVLSALLKVAGSTVSSKMSGSSSKSSSSSSSGSGSASSESSSSQENPIEQLQALMDTKDDTLRAALTESLQKTIAKPEHRADRYTVQWVAELVRQLERNLPGKKEELAAIAQAEKEARLKAGQILAKGAAGLYEEPDKINPSDLEPLPPIAPGADPMLSVFRDLSPRDQRSEASEAQMEVLQAAALKRMLAHALTSADPAVKKQALAAYLSYTLTAKQGSKAASQSSSVARSQVLKEVVALMQQAHNESLSSSSSSERSFGSSSASASLSGVSASQIQSLAKNMSALSSMLQSATGNKIGSLDVQGLTSMFADFASRNGFLPSESDALKSDSGAILRLAKPVSSAAISANILPTDANAIASAVKDALSKADSDIKHREAVEEERQKAERKLAAEKEQEADLLTRRVAAEVKLLESKLGKLQAEREQAEKSHRKADQHLSRGSAEEASKSDEEAREHSESSNSISTQIETLHAKIKHDMDTIKKLRAERLDYMTGSKKAHSSSSAGSESSSALKSLNSLSLGDAKPEEIYLDMHKVLTKMDRMQPAQRSAVIGRLLHMLQQLHGIGSSSSSSNSELKKTESKLRSELASSLKKELHSSSVSSQEKSQLESDLKALNIRQQHHIKLNNLQMERRTDTVEGLSTKLTKARHRMQQEEEALAAATTEAAKKPIQVRLRRAKAEVRKLARELTLHVAALKQHVQRDEKLRGVGSSSSSSASSAAASSSSSSLPKSASMSALDSSIESTKAELSAVEAATKKAMSELSSMSQEFSSESSSKSSSLLEIDGDTNKEQSRHNNYHRRPITPSRDAQIMHNAAVKLEGEPEWAPGLKAELDSVDRLTASLAEPATAEYARLNREALARVHARAQASSTRAQAAVKSALLELDSTTTPHLQESDSEVDDVADTLVPDLDNERLRELREQYAA